MIRALPLLFALSAASVAPAADGPAYRVTSRNTEPQRGYFGSPAWYAAGRLYYQVGLPWPADRGLQVWDPESRRSTLLAEMYTGPVAELDGATYFLGSQLAGTGLWTTDGTPAGTRLVQGTGFGPPDLVAAGGLLYFLDLNSTVWRSDGTTRGTFALPATGSSLFGRPELIAFGRDLLFLEYDGPAKRVGLWKTRGTAASTVRIADLRRGDEDEPYGHFAYALAAVNGRAVFFTSEGSTTFTLWASDGTESGTAPLRNFGSDLGGYPEYRYPVGPSRPVGELGLFAANDGIHGRELWRTDGTRLGTRLVRDIAPGPAGSSRVETFADPDLISGAIRGVQLLAADDGVHGLELWRSDGTEAGTYLVSDLVPGSGDSMIGWFARAGDRFLFLAAGGLYRSDGTAAGTTLFEGLNGLPAELPTGAATVASGSGLRRTDGHGVELIDDGPYVVGTSVYGMVSAGGEAFFVDLDSLELWSSDGTDAGTTSLTSFSEVPDLHAAGGRAYFVPVSDASHGEPWVSDGTPEGTHALADMPNSNASEFTQLGRRVFFSARDDEHGQELWTTNGTDDTHLVADIAPGRQESAPHSFAAAGHLLYFATSVPGGLWRSDGRPEGTTQIASFDVREIVGGPEALFAFGSDGDRTALWTSDGTAAGTRLIGRDFWFVAHPAIAGRRIFFDASTTTQGGELWVSDGTEAGTRRVHAFVGIGAIVSFGDGTVLVSAYDEHGAGLWRSDGTAEGTALVRGMLSGADAMLAIGGVVLFSAFDAAHGFELWISDGTADGTRLLQEVYPGPQSSSLASLVDAGSLVFFRARDPEAGDQLWALPKSAITSVAPPRESPRTPRTLSPRD